MELEEALKLIEAQKAEIEESATEREALKSITDSLNVGDVKSLADKVQELLGETKKAKNKAKEESDAAAKAIADKARKDGDYEQLLKSSEEERERLSAQLSTVEASVSKERVGSAAMKIAAELADGHNATILSDFIARRLKSTSDGLKVLSEDGELTVSTLEQLSVEFKSNERYNSLLRGNQASGGGATGGDGSAAINNPFKTEHFNLTEQAALLKADPAKYAALKVAAQTK